MTSGSIVPPRRRDRRIEKGRESIELMLDAVFRPAGWAAAVAYRLGLQGRVQTSIDTVHLPSRNGHDPVERRPLRIAFASDFHAGATTHPQVLAEACDALVALSPDVLLLGGDFVTVRAASIEALARELARIPAPLGKFAVLGNHDLRANTELVVTHLEQAGIRMLTNRYVTLPPPFDDIEVCGLDDPTRGTPCPETVLDHREATRIVVMHSPEGLDTIGDRQFRLALCGHTHGGQIVTPWGTPLFVPGGRLNRRYPGGRYELAGSADPRTLIVTRGVGCSTLPVRLFSAPEVHLCLIV